MWGGDLVVMGFGEVKVFPNLCSTQGVNGPAKLGLWSAFLVGVGAMHAAVSYEVGS